MAHTSGPWIAKKYGYERYSINGNKGVEVAACHNHANARAIAALPDLLAALNAIAAYPLPFVEDAEQRLQMLIGFMDLARSAARAAIAKATGA